MFTQALGIGGRALGLLDTLTAPHGIERYVELVAPTWSRREVRGRIEAVRHETADSVTLTLRPNGNWTGFEAGQHTQVCVEIDGVRHTRCYSMCSSAHRADGRFELTVKAQAGGTVSPFLVARARPGMVVGLSPAQGTFTLPATRPDRLLLVSGGSGITPVLSMLRTLVDEGYAGSVTFLHYCFTRADQIAREELDRLAAEHPNVSVLRSYVDEPGVGELDGLFGAEHLEVADPRWVDAEVYVCGPAPLMDVVHALYDAHGLGARVHSEAFVLGSFLAEAGDIGGELRFAGAGVSVASDGRPLLDQAEAAGLRPAHGCRMGICHTCTRPLCSGTVRDVTSGALTDEVGTGVRLCVSVPVGDVTIDL